MKLQCLPNEFSVCKVEDYTLVDLKKPFCFIGTSEEENSLVCPSVDVPVNVIMKEDGWKAFRIEGILDFSMVGVLSKIATLLAENTIGIFAVSTYNTDYIFTKQEQFQNTLSILSIAGYEID